MEDRFYCHEIGHGIIAHIFNGFITDFEGVTFSSEVVKGVNLNVQDLGYTITKAVTNLAEVVEADQHLAAAVDGLMLLAGIAGASFLPPVAIQNKEVTITCENFKQVLDVRGSEGDFEIIRNARRPYGWYLYTAGNHTDISALIIHCRIMNVLQQLFMSENIQHGARILFDLIKSRKNQTLTPEDFSNTYNAEFVNRINNNLRNQLSFGVFGLMTR